MFNHPFYPLGVDFKQLLEQWRETPSPTTRFTAFMHAAHGTFFSFLDEPHLLSMKMTVVTTTEVQKQPLFVRFRHHFKHELVFDNRPTIIEDCGSWAAQNLPYESIGEGVFEIRRDDAIVQRQFALKSDELEAYSALVYELARKMDLALSVLETAHDVGLDTASMTR